MINDVNRCKETHTLKKDGKGDISFTRHTPGRYWDLGEASQSRGLSQTYEGDERFVQKIHLTNHDIGRFGIARNLLHELILQLEEERGTGRGNETERG